MYVPQTIPAHHGGHFKAFSPPKQMLYRKLLHVWRLFFSTNHAYEELQVISTYLCYPTSPYITCDGPFPPHSKSFHQPSFYQIFSLVHSKDISQDKSQGFLLASITSSQEYRILYHITHQTSSTHFRIRHFAVHATQLEFPHQGQASIGEQCQQCTSMVLSIKHAIKVLMVPSSIKHYKLSGKLQFTHNQNTWMITYLYGYLHYL